MPERTAWTDERIGDRMASMEARFDRVDSDLRELREEVRGVRVDLNRFQDRLVQIGFGLAAAQFTTLIAVIVTRS